MSETSDVSSTNNQQDSAPPVSTEDLFDVVVYLVNSAPTSLGETPSLAAFRMVDAAHRLLTILERSTSDPDQLEFLAAAKSDYEAHFNLVMTDQQAFQEWLPEFVRRCTQEAMRRMASSHQLPLPSPVNRSQAADGELT